jgi:predicted phosphoadenosine phosphosulfate sulfurtransferase
MSVKFLWGRQPDGGNVLDAARLRMETIYQQFDEVVVSFSGGKDSTAVLNLAIEAARKYNRLPVRAIFFDEEAIAWETEDYVRRVSQTPEVQLDWYCIPIRHRNGASFEDGFWFPWANEEQDKWVRPMPPEAITEVPGLDLDSDAGRAPIDELISYICPPGNGKVATVLGIRASESLTRLKAVTARGREYAWMQHPSKHTPWITKCYPVYDWRTEDVWTAPAQLGWDYNQYYDILEMCGMGHNQQRCAPPYGDEPLRSLHLWQETHPDLWDKMVVRVPGAAAAARYANTELYAAYEPLVLRPGQDPTDYIKELILSHATPEMQNAAAEAARRIIKMHYNKTTEPIAVNARHHYSGVSWRMVAKAARTGDLKRRTLVNITPGTKGVEGRRASYLRELYELREQGCTWLPDKLPPLEDTE